MFATAAVLGRRMEGAEVSGTEVSSAGFKLDDDTTLCFTSGRQPRI